jgi:hypothetical protein
MRTMVKDKRDARVTCRARLDDIHRRGLCHSSLFFRALCVPGSRGSYGYRQCRARKRQERHCAPPSRPAIVRSAADPGPQTTVNADANARDNWGALACIYKSCWLGPTNASSRSFATLRAVLAQATAHAARDRPCLTLQWTPSLPLPSTSSRSPLRPKPLAPSTTSLRSISQWITRRKPARLAPA